MSGNYLLKMELIAELKEVSKLIEANRQTGEILLSTLTWLNRYCEENGIRPPNQEKISNQMARILGLLGETDESYHREDSDGKLPEP